MALMPAYKAALMQLPNEGTQMLEVTHALGAGGSSGELDLWEEMSANEISMVQSVWLDNSKSLSTLELQLTGINRGQRIVVSPGHQGWYAVTVPMGVLRYTLFGQANTTFTIIFANVCLPYADWGPVSGVLQVPTLIPVAADITRVGDGDVVVLAGVPGKSIQVYRANLWIDNPATLKFKGSGGADLTGPMTLFAGGLLNWQPSGVPWISTIVGEGLTANFAGTGGATIHLGGTFGYQLV